MKHLFVPYKLALKLKEKGFKEECICGYNSFKLLTSKVSYSTGNDCECRWDDRYDTDVRAPLYQQVIDWFDKKGIHIDITPEFYKDGINWNFQVFEYAPDFFNCTSNRSSMMCGDNHEYPTRKDAIIGGIKEALKLI